MSVCDRCAARSSRPCGYVGMTREYFRVLIAPLRHVARRCGYALAVHGSLRTDIDLVAVPWREHPIEAASLAEELRLVTERIIGIAELRPPLPTAKPCGRLGWAIHLVPLGASGPYIDLSVLQPNTPPPPRARGSKSPKPETTRGAA